MRLSCLVDYMLIMYGTGYSMDADLNFYDCQDFVYVMTSFRLDNL